MRRRLVTAAIDGAFVLGGRVARRLPQAAPNRYGVERIADVDYAGTGAEHHRLDIYRPRAPAGLRPAVLYTHGGAWRMLSKDSHFMMALVYAASGYVVFNVNYRLAPAHRHPAALEDAVDAYRFVRERAPEFGADPERIVLAGESAGANIALALTTMACFERPEPYARVMLEGPPPAALAPACGLLQLSDVDRFSRRRALPWWLQEYLASIPETVLRGMVECPALLDPLLVLESDAEPVRALPPTWLGVGTADPVLDDTRRLAAALGRRGVDHRVEYYRRGPHAFQAIVPLGISRRFWRDQLEFLSARVG